MRHPLGEVHKSDPTCLARFKAHADGLDTDTEAARQGTLCHRVVERFAYESERGTPSPMSVVREVLHEAVAAGEASERVVSQVVEIMAAAFGRNSRLDFGIPQGYTIRPEWRWALDENFEPLQKDWNCKECGGRGWVGTPPDDFDDCPACESDPHAPAYAGQIDRLAWGKTLEVTDYKSVLAYGSAEDVRVSFEARMYVFATLQHFPDAKEAGFAHAFLRHGYATRYLFKRGEPWEEATKAAMRARRAARLRAIETNVWPETMGRVCGYCPIIGGCKKQADARLHGPMPGATWTEKANVYLGLQVQLAALKRECQEQVALTGLPIPLDTPDGEVLGKAPATRWHLKDSYEQTMAGLERLCDTPDRWRAIFDEHFRFVLEKDIAGRVRRVLELLVTRRVAKDWIERGDWIEPEGAEEFSVWTPPDAAPVAPDVPATEQFVEDAIARAARDDPERLRRALEGLA